MCADPHNRQLSLFQRYHEHGSYDSR
jgi:hypothetical protein